MITIGISYSEIEKAIRRGSEYEGLKNGHYDAERALEQDDAQLRFYFSEGVSLACVVLDRLLARKVVVDDINDGYTLTLKTDNDNSPLIEETLRQIVVSHVLWKWLRLMNPDKSAFYKQDESEQLEELKRMCYYREMPK